MYTNSIKCGTARMGFQRRTFIYSHRIIIGSARIRLTFASYRQHVHIIRSNNCSSKLGFM